MVVHWKGDTLREEQDSQTGEKDNWEFPPKNLFQGLYSRVTKEKAFFNFLIFYLNSIIV